MLYLKIYGIAFAIFLLVDLIWLTLISKNLYNKYLSSFMGKVRWIPALLFYLLFILGLTFFVIEPSLTKASFSYALFAGILFGLITYATYDLTNLATLKNWPIQITIIDLIWGMFLGGFVSSITFFILR
ncbi:MAG: DUF2177 family protein [Firmicutes bacterium]|nr:DUF2177 family protein [Bacillota bacterium]